MINHKDVVIGIDLGTSYSSVGVWINGQVIIIPNEYGNKRTSSTIALTDQLIIIGDQSINQIHNNIYCTIDNIKRLIGKRIDQIQIKDKDNQNNYLIYQDYKIIQSQDNYKTIIKIKRQQKQIQWSTQFITAMILNKIKKITEQYLGFAVEDCVITVPACFNNSQRLAIQNSAKISQLNLIGLVNQTTAAAISYLVNQQIKQETNLLIINLGGGFYDVSIINIDDILIQVKATFGNNSLGGIDFDTQFTNYCAKDFQNRTGMIIIHEPNVMKRLRKQCEKAKIALSTAVQTTVKIDKLYQSYDYCVVISRQDFQSICSCLLKQILEPIQNVMQYSKMEKNQIHDIILIGGSTNIFYIKNIIQQYFNGKQVKRLNQQNKAVCLGATTHAASIYSKIQDNPQIITIDITSFSVGIQVSGGIMKTMIPRNSIIPINKSLKTTTYSDNNPGINLRIYSGQNPRVKDNHLMGRLSLGGIIPAPRGVPDIQIKFIINQNGIVNIQAQDLNHRKKLIVNWCRKNTLTPLQLTQLTLQLKQLILQNYKIQNNKISKYNIYKYLNNIKQILNSKYQQSIIPKQIKQTLILQLKQIQQIINTNSKQQQCLNYFNKLNQIQSIIQPYLSYITKLDIKRLNLGRNSLLNRFKEVNIINQKKRCLIQEDQQSLKSD